MSQRVLNDKWFWMTVGFVVLIVVLPLIVVWGILQLPPILAGVATVCIIVVWGIVAGYKDWIMSERKRAEEKSSQG